MNGKSQTSRVEQNPAGNRRLKCRASAPGEREILQQAQAGDARAFEVLYRRHKARVYRLCLRMVKNEALAEDLTQETFLQVFRKLHTFRQEAAFTTWLHRVTSNTVFMYLRKRRLPSISIEELEQPQSNSNDASPCRELGREDPALRSCVDRLTFQNAWTQMPNGYRTVLSLHDILGYRHPEIASRLKCSVGNSKSQLHKARLRLRSSLLREPPATPEKLAA